MNVVARTSRVWLSGSLSDWRAAVLFLVLMTSATLSLLCLKYKSPDKDNNLRRLAASAKDVLIGARFGQDEAAIIERAVKRDAMGKSEWVRFRLLAAAQSGNG